MKYCDNCGKEINENSNFCQNCGKNFSSENEQKVSNSGSIIGCAIVGLMFPIIGAILYYVLKKSDIKAAKVANICSWIGFLLQFLFFLFWRIPIFIFM